jgi:hypothetical protein
VPSEATNDATRQEWRELGFFYDRDDAAGQWKIHGSKEGLEKFAASLDRYAANPNHADISEHDHLGPYMYLKFGTWPTPQLNSDWLAGPLPALAGLARNIRAALITASVDQTLSFRSAFAPSEPYDLLLTVESDSFDPARADDGCW